MTLSTSKQEFLPFSRPSIDERDMTAVSQVLRSGWITTGAKAAELEQRFCQRLGCRYAVAVSSATAGMHLLLHALGIGPGDEIITPSLTWVSTVNQIVMRGARPVFVDVDRDTLMTTAGQVEPHLSERTRLIIPVHFAGAALDLEPLRQLATRYGIPLVEDAAHALGTTYRGQPIGQKGTAIFSFHPTKNLTTGEGGLVCTDDPALAERIRRLKFHGLGVDAFDRETQGRSPQAEVLEPGYKYNLADLNAALGVSQLQRLDAMNRRRTELAEQYRSQLALIDAIQPLTIPSDTTQHAWHLFVVRLAIERVSKGRDDFMTALKQCGIGTGLHFRAVHQQKYYREHYPVQPGCLPATDWNSARICSLPLFPAMRNSDVTQVVQAIEAILQ